MKIIEQSYDWQGKPTYRLVTTDLILHHAGGRGSAQDIHRQHLRSTNPVYIGIAYHYYVRMDGSIYRGRPENWYGGHCLNNNWCSIGVCFEGNFEYVDEMPQVQRDAGKALVADIVRRYPGIRVGLHKQYVATACPGAWFPAEEIIRGAKQTEGEDAEAGSAPPAWAQEACDRMVDLGIFRGDGQSFRWNEPITRAEMAVVLDRMLNIGK